MQIVIATATFVRSIEEIRAQLALKTVAAAKQHGYIIVVVDGSPSPEFKSALTSHGALVFEEQEKGMGPSRRQCLREAEKLMGDAGVWAFTEPEKYTLIPHMQKLAASIIEKKADLVIPNRGKLDSYPLEQQHGEYFSNEAFKLVTGHQLDMQSGPRIGNKHSLRHFLDYNGRFGDLWDATHIPVISCIQDGLRVISVPVPYIHPPEQTAAEAGKPEFIKKRAQQIWNLVPAYVEAAQEAGLYRA